MNSNRLPRFEKIRCCLFALFTICSFNPSPATALPSTNGLILWLDSSYAATVQTNFMGRVISWTNKAPGITNSVVYTGNNDNMTSASFNNSPPAFEPGPNGIRIVHFFGNGYLDNLNFSTAKPSDLTVFLLAAARTNPGSYSAFISFNQSSTANDYQTGFNFDLGLNPSTTFNRLNVQGAKASGEGGFPFASGQSGFNAFQSFEVNYGGGEDEDHSQITVLANGISQLSTIGTDDVVNLNRLYIGTRSYVSGNVPTANHNFVGFIACVLVYDRHLETEELTQTRAYLNNFFNRPTLRVTTTNNNSVLISWPSSFTDWQLEQSANLSSANWELSTNTIVTQGTNRYSIVNPPSGIRYFRLKR